MSHSVKIVEDSIAPNGVRLTTFALNYPMIIHWDFLTHRALSRNAESGRVISVSRRVDKVQVNPFRPEWMSDDAGMRSGEPFTGFVKLACDEAWDNAMRAAIRAATRLAGLGAHREQVNSLLIPFGHISVVASATSWDNFLALRAVPGARSEFVDVARDMGRQLRDHAPRSLAVNEWHLPFVTVDERSRWTTEECRAASVARCARTTYLGHDGKAKSIADEVAAHDRREADGHWSPFEHQGTPASSGSHRSGNFNGWHQYRQLLNKSVHDRFDLASIDAEAA